MRLFFILFPTLAILSLSSCATRITTQPKTVTYIKTAPRQAKVVKVKGKRFYFWNGKHYRKTRRGYVFIRV